MDNELGLNVNVICLVMLGLFFVCIVADVALWFYGRRKGRAEMWRAKAEARETEMAEANAAAVVAEAEAVIKAAQLRLFGEAGW